MVRKLQEQDDVDIHYMVNITGHGWRKLMRGPKNLTYRMSMVPEVPPVFDFIQTASESTLEDMYGNYNMGAGFAVYVPEGSVKSALAAIKSAGFTAWDAGAVEEGDQKVIIEPIDLTFMGDSLGVRG